MRHVFQSLYSPYATDIMYVNAKFSLFYVIQSHYTEGNFSWWNIFSLFIVRMSWKELTSSLKIKRKERSWILFSNKVFEEREKK